MITITIKYLLIIILTLGIIDMFGGKKNMNTKYEAGKKYYFRSVSHYHTPSKLYNEMEYKYFEDAYTDCFTGIFNEKNNLIVFERWYPISIEYVNIKKYLPKEIISDFIDNLYPALYYSIIKEKGIEKPGKQIDIKIAEELLEYYRLTFDVEKQDIVQHKMSKKIMRVVTYSYDENGKLKESKHISSDGEEIHFFYDYDEKGKMASVTSQSVSDYK